MQEKAKKPKGASHQSKGVGRGAGTIKGANGKFMRASEVGMQTMPLPSTVEEVNNASMADFFASGAYTPPAGGLVLEAVPLTSSPLTAA